MSPEVPSPHSIPLREEFTEQPRLSAFTLEVTGDTNPLLLTPHPEDPEQPGNKAVADTWLDLLDGDTTLQEVLYLLGIEAESEREEKVADLLDQAVNRDIEVGPGHTLGDLRRGNAPDLYTQLFQPQLRPKLTPEGTPFPYSHFGDPEARVGLLRDVNRSFSLHPDVVVNVGSGYDITPSDAFPNARVVHVDIQPDIVEFLRQSGFEAYQPDQFPNDLSADLIINILGPSGQGNVPLSPRGTLLTTESRYIPDDMVIKGLVPATRREILPPVNDPDTIKQIVKSGPDIHLVALTKA
jgi:hypothetical protein